MEYTHDELRRRFRRDRSRKRRRVKVAAAVLAACFIVSLFFRTAMPGFIPVEAIKNLLLLFKLAGAWILQLPYYYQKDALIDACLYYGETVSRLITSVFTMFSGMALGLAGAVFQHVYRNPVASPSTIGAAAGVNLGNLILVMVFSYAAAGMILYRYLLCTALTIGIMIVVMVVGSIAGYRTGNYSVLEMLMFGSILSRMINAFNTYWMYHFTGSALMAYQEITLGIYQVFDARSTCLFFCMIFVGIGLLLKMRFRINAVGMDPMEMKSAGVDVRFERVAVQLLSALIVAAACIQCGDVGLFALVIPHIARYVHGADFRSLALFSTIYGGIFLLIVRMISSMIFLGSRAVPMTFIVSIVMIPVFMAVLVKSRRGFD